MSLPFAPLATRILVLLAALALLPAPALAQSAGGGDLGEVIYLTTKDGHGYDFEEGVKRHMAIAAEQGNPSAWLVWEIMTGENTGGYLVGTFGHTWADFDMQPEDPMQNQMSFLRNIQPHVADAQVGFWRFRQDLSRGTAGEGAPARFLQVYHFMPKYDAVQAAEAAFVRIKEAANAANWPGSQWEVHQLVNGGQLPHYAVIIPGESFADFAEPEPTMYEMLVSQMGEDEANALFQRFSAAIASENSEMLAFRQDLSYMPEGGM